MKHDKELRSFLEKYININDDRLKKARKIVNPEDGTLIKFLENNLGECFTSIYQWSFSYHTIIKPHQNDDVGKYDVDLAIQLNYKKEWEWEECKYHALIIDCLKNSERYKAKLDESKERAIRVQYDSNDGEFYVDLVPMFHDWKSWNVINRKSNAAEISWGTEFRDWVNAQNNKTSTEDTSAKFLKETIRIYKYLRNKSNPDLISSVKLTLLLAKQIDLLTDDNVVDLSTTLYEISIQLKSELLSANKVSDLDLSNPWLPEEIFDRNFTDEQFQEFKEWIIEVIDKIEGAYNETDADESILKWNDIFGEEFGLVRENWKKIYSLVNYTHAKNSSDLGWRRWDTTDVLKIIWTKASNRNPSQRVPFISNERLPKNLILSFYAQIKGEENGTLYWQVTNDNNTYVKNPRWGINNESTSLWYSKKYKWYWIQETWVWRGKHWVKCYFINKNNQIIWESERFYVNIL